MGEVWAEPPKPGNRGSFDWNEIAQRLRAKPGEWLLIFENGPRGTANGVRQGHVLVFQEPGFEVTTRNNNVEAGTCTLYMRYVPPAQTTPRRKRV
jgi:hypothetical protein